MNSEYTNQIPLALLDKAHSIIFLPMKLYVFILEHFKIIANTSFFKKINHKPSPQNILLVVLQDFLKKAFPI